MSSGGVTLFFFRWVAVGLGTALVVGPLFFVQRLWLYLGGRLPVEHETLDRAYGNVEYANLQRLNDKRAELLSRARRLREPDLFLSE